MKYEISIPEPCSENWNRMTPTEQGRFCGSCQEEVIDFTRKSDAELLQMIQSGKKFCGRYRNTQLDKIYTIPSKPKLWQKYVRYGLAAGLGFLSVLGYGQSPKDSIVIEQKLNTNKRQVADNQLDTVPKIVLSGVVLDTLGVPIAFANVSYEMDGVFGGESTDLDGRFRIELPSYDTIAITFSSLGYMSKKIVYGKNAQNLRVELGEDVEDVLEICTGMVVRRIFKKGDEGKTSFWNRRGIFIRD